ncbi:MAG: TlpA disulfide reductase family protein [Planctomycetota bacterium]
MMTLTCAAVLMVGCADDGTPTEGDTTATSKARSAGGSTSELVLLTQDPEVLLTKVWEAYQSPPALSDDSTIVFKTGQSSNNQLQLKTVIDEHGNYRLDLPGMALTAQDDNLYFEQVGNTMRYLRIPRQRSTQQALVPVFNSPAPLLLTLPVQLRESPSIGAAAAAFGIGMFENPVLQGADVTTGPGGTPAPRLSFGINGGRVDAYIDPSTFFVTALNFDGMVMNQGRAQRRAGQILSSVTPLQSITTPVAFNPQNRREVTERQQMSDFIIGEAAPEFALPTLDGDIVTLSSMRGQVVVLDFWATWCGPCMRGLPLLNEFSQWARSSGLPVRVYGVNTLERMPPESITSSVRQFWSQRGFDFPTLIDKDRAMAAPYWLRSIPLTVVIDRDGRIAHVHRGFDPNMNQKLQTEVMNLVRQSG